MVVQVSPGAGGGSTNTAMDGMVNRTFDSPRRNPRSGTHAVREDGQRQEISSPEDCRQGCLEVGDGGGEVVPCDPTHSQSKLMRRHAHSCRRRGRQIKPAAIEQRGQGGAGVTAVGAGALLPVRRRQGLVAPFPAP